MLPIRASLAHDTRPVTITAHARAHPLKLSACMYVPCALWEPRITFFLWSMQAGDVRIVEKDIYNILLLNKFKFSTTREDHVCNYLQIVGCFSFCRHTLGTHTDEPGQFSLSKNI